MFNKMGNLFSSNHSPSLEYPVTEHIVYDQSEIQHYRRQTDDYRRQMDELARENKALKHYNQTLRNEQHKLATKIEQLTVTMNRSQSRRSNPPKIKTSISTEHIKRFVDEMLEDPEINIYGFPDAIEKQVYRNVFNMVLRLLDHVVETSEVKLFGHKMVFDIQPIENNEHATATASAELPE